LGGECGEASEDKIGIFFFRGSFGGFVLGEEWVLAGVIQLGEYMYEVLELDACRLIQCCGVWCLVSCPCVQL
jgi:hypothetical protein